MNNRISYELPYGKPDPAEPRKLPKSQSDASAKQESSNYEIKFVSVHNAPVLLHSFIAVIFLLQTIRGNRLWFEGEVIQNFRIHINILHIC